MNKNREQLQTKIAECLRDNGCSSDGAPNRYFAAGKVLDLIEQSPVAEPVQEKVDMQIDGVNYIVPKSMADGINKILQDAVRNDGEKQPTPELLLTTEDGYKCYDGDRMVYGIDDIWECGLAYAEQAKDNHEFKWFSSPEARTTYIADNKPMFSYRELQILIDGRPEALRTIQKWNSEQLVWQIRQIAMNKVANKQ